MRSMALQLLLITITITIIYWLDIDEPPLWNPRIHLGVGGTPTRNVKLTTVPLPPIQMIVMVRFILFISIFMFSFQRPLCFSRMAQTPLGPFVLLFCITPEASIAGFIFSYVCRMSTFHVSSPPEPRLCSDVGPNRGQYHRPEAPLPQIVPPSSNTKYPCVNVSALVRRRCSHGSWSDPCCSHETFSHSPFFLLFLSKTHSICHRAPPLSCFRQQGSRWQAVNVTGEAIRALSRICRFDGLLQTWFLILFHSPKAASLVLEFY